MKIRNIFLKEGSSDAIYFQLRAKKKHHLVDVIFDKSTSLLDFSILFVISAAKPSINFDCHGVQVCRICFLSTKDEFYTENGQVEYMASNKMPLS